MMESNVGEINYQPLEAPSPAAKRGALLPQVTVAVAAALTHLGIGAAVGFSGITSLQMMNGSNTDDPNLILSSTDMSVFGSIICVGSVAGCVAGGWLMVWYGQRNTLLAVMPLALAGWLTVSFGEYIWILQMGRLIIGFTSGVVITTAANYVIECVHPDIRETLSGLVDLMRQFGFILVYATGCTSLSWRQTAAVCGFATTLLPFAGLLLLPHSPRWLVSKRRHEDSRRALAFLRGNKYNVGEEFSSIISHHDIRNDRGTLNSQFRNLREKSVVKRLLSLIVMYIFHSFTGSVPFLVYAIKNFQYSNPKINPYLSTFLLGVMKVLGSLTFILIGDKLRRKTLIQIPLIIGSCCLLLLGCYFYFQNKVDYTMNLKWVPHVCILLYMYVLCIMPIMIIPGEVLPNHVRAISNSLLYIISSVSLFAVTISFPFMVSSILMHGTIWFYACSCIIVLIVVYFHIPETGGRSLESIDFAYVS